MRLYGDELHSCQYNMVVSVLMETSMFSKITVLLINNNLHTILFYEMFLKMCFICCTYHRQVS